MARRSKPTKKSNKPVPTKQNTNLPHPTSSGTSVLGNIGQGITFGAGAAIGNSMINSTIDAFSKDENNSSQNTNTQHKCDEIIIHFKECMKNTSTESFCTPYINMYNECIKNTI